MIMTTEYRLQVQECSIINTIEAFRVIVINQLI